MKCEKRAITITKKKHQFHFMTRYTETFESLIELETTNHQPSSSNINKMSQTFITAKAESSGGDPVLLSIPAYLSTIATDPNEDTRYFEMTLSNLYLV